MPRELEPWARELAADLRALPGELDRHLEAEADDLAATIGRLAPRASGRLSRSFEGRGSDVTTSAPYATLQSEGGRVRARAHGLLVIPVRPGYRPGPGLTTVRTRRGESIVIRSGTYELWAVRRREVRIRGTRYLARGLEQHLRRADERTAAVLPAAEEG